MEQNKIVTYYVIKDLATWTTRGCKQSVCERYEHAEEAMQQFRDYAQWQTVIEDKRIRATLGIRIKGLDFDERKMEIRLPQELRKKEAVQKDLYIT